MRDPNIHRLPRFTRHTHPIPESPENLEVSSEPGAQIFDFNSILQSRENVPPPLVDDINSTADETDHIIETEDRRPPKTLSEKRLDSIFSVAIGSLIFGAIYPAVNNMENQTVQEGSVAGLASFLGWGIFYVSIPYLQDSKLGRYFAKKDKKINN